MRLLMSSTVVVSCCYADTIESAMTEAYKNNTEIKDKIAALRAANEQEVQAKAGYRPSIQLATSVQRSDANISGDYVDQSRQLANIGTPGGANAKTGSTTNQFQAQFSQNLYQGGNTAYQIEGAEATIKAARAELMATVQSVMFNAVGAYIDLQTSTENLRLLTSNENVLKKQLESAQEKFNVGEETRTSVAQAHAKYADGISKRLAAEADVEGKKATYERIIGKRPGSLAKPTLPRNMPTQLTSAVDKAMAMNPIISQYIYNEIAARRQIDVIHSGLLPKVDFQASSTRQEALNSKKYAGLSPTAGSFDTDTLLKERANNTNNQLALTATWTLYDGGTTRSKKRQAAHTAEQKRVAIETQRRTIKELLTQQWEIYIANKDTMIKRKDQVKAYEIALDGTEQELKVGSKILLDVLNAQLDLVTAQQALVSAENAYFKASYQIVQLIGALTPKDMKLDVQMYDPLVNYEEVRYRW